MICYQDMTFCSSDCVNSECLRFLSPIAKDGARKWWYHDPDNAPIATSDFSDNCEYYEVVKCK